MRSSILRLLRSPAGLAVLPALFVAGCPADDASENTTAADSSSSSGSATDPSETDTDPSATLTQGSSSGVDPDSSSGDPTDASSSTDPSGSSSSGGETCGNGAIDAGEDCDGAELGDATCESIDKGFDGGDLACADDCTFDTSACVMATCGNDLIEGTEVCDGTDVGSDCASEGFPLGGELGCLKNCSDYDTSGCLSQVCGNDTAEGDESCDGADLAGVTCESIGFDGGALACADDCNGFDTAGCYSCGDGVASGAEVCDGDDLAGATCGDLGYDGGTPTCAADCTSVTPDGCLLATTTDYCMEPGNGGLIQDFLTLDNDIVVAGSGQVTDINIVLAATHTYVGDLNVSVTHVDTGATSQLFSSQCGTVENVDATFDQDGALFGCGLAAPAISGTIAPEAPGDLDAIAPAVGDGTGTWRLSIADGAGGDTGTLDAWCVQITALAPVSTCDGLELDPGNGIVGCWYTSANVNMSCTEVCEPHGGFDAVASQHNGNAAGFAFWPDKVNGGEWMSIECSSTDNNTNWGANGQAPDPFFIHEACYVNCACVN